MDESQCPRCGGRLFREDTTAKIMTVKCLNCARTYYRPFNETHIYQSYQEAKEIAIMGSGLRQQHYWH